MHQKPADKLQCRQAGFFPAHGVGFFLVNLVIKMDPILFDSDQTVIADRGPVGVKTQILDHFFRAGEGVGVGPRELVDI